MKTDRDETMEMFNRLTPEQQQQLEGCFDDGDVGVFENVGNYEAWQRDATEEDYAAVYEKIRTVLASISWREQ